MSRSPTRCREHSIDLGRNWLAERLLKLLNGWSLFSHQFDLVQIGMVGYSEYLLLDAPLSLGRIEYQHGR